MLPHADLDHYYHGQDARRGFITALFDDTAVDYDRINAVMALGTGVRYRRDALRRAGVRPEHRVLDIATGTGLVCAAARAAGVPADHVIGVDPSAGMLAHHSGRGQHRLVRGCADALPFADEQFDLLTMGYALRHVDDLVGALREYRRVLRPGGRVLLLEISEPRTFLGRAFTRFYFGGVVPRLARLRAKSARAKDLMDYYWATIAACVPPAKILQALADAGFADIRRHVVLGIFSEYTARRA
jgi:demethylmenaquinone methyltransferase/2-methoxy-6-polyprenyl-1,4-benzoquinol methylase